MATPPKDTRTPEQKKADKRKTRFTRAADGLDRAIQAAKMSLARLDEREDGAQANALDEAIDGLRGVRDYLRDPDGSDAKPDETPST